MANFAKSRFQKIKISMITVLDYLALKGTPTSNGSAFVTGRSLSGDGGEGVFLWDSTSTEASNGATIIESTLTSSGRWKRVIEEKVNVRWFGAKADCYKGSSDFSILPSGTDNTIAIQSAIDFCIVNRYDLYFPAGKRNASGINAEYMVTDTLNINAPLAIYAETEAKITGFIKNKTKPIFRIENCDQGKIENLTIQGCGYLPLAGIEFVSNELYHDSQGMELNNLKIHNCRHGIYSAGGETINRIVVNRCVIMSNLIAGFYLKSFEGSAYTASAPITFIHTILNANGIPEFLAQSPSITYDGVTVLNPTDKYGYQFYAKGFGNLSYIGGQISAHGAPRLLSMVSLDRGAGVSFIGVDIEDITSPVTEAGTLIKNFDLDYGATEGAAINVSNVLGFNFAQSSFWQLNTQSVFKFVGRLGDANIQVVNLESGNFKYSIDVIHANYDANEVMTRLKYDGDKVKLSPSAFAALDRSGLEVLTSIKGPLLPTTPGIDAIFTNKPKNAAGSQYAVGYIGTSFSPTFSTGPYITKAVNAGSVVYALIECTQNAFTPHGKFFIQQTGSFGSQHVLVDLKGGGLIGNTYYTYAKYVLNPLTTSIKYGFINSQNYVGNIPDHATVKGFTVYIDYKNPVQKRRPIDLDF